jgi:NAD(P)-dependent dehydrogenase (short-subunit alcohol dehydrogenase family)
MRTRFTHKVALVTGGGSGIGRAVAVAFGREAAAVVVAGRRAEPLEHTAALIEAEGGVADAVVADVSVAGDVERLMDTVVSRYGRLDIASNNAGVLGAPAPVADLEEATWSEVLAINLTGLWLSMKQEIRQMRAAGGGAIVNTASNVGAHMRVPGLGTYTATKAAVSALTRTAALENIRAGVRINAISPGPADTDMSRLPGETDEERDARMNDALPIGRVASVDEVAAAVLWLASPESSFVVGHDLVIDGGATA